MTTETDTRASDLVVVAPLIVTDASHDEIVTTVETADVQTTVAGTFASVVTVGSEVVTTVTAEQGPQGVPGSDGAAPTFDATNKSGATIAAGNVVATHPSGIGVVLANATNDTRPAIGLSQGSAVDLATATIQTSGPFELADWTAITGTADLAAKANYYLSTTAGMLTATSPTSRPEISHMIGRAVSPRILDLNIGRIIRL